MLDRLRIVLIEPSGPANVGAICRAMANFGLSELVVVAPRCHLQNPEAVAAATHGRRVLDAARIVPDVPTALADCVESYVSTSKLGLYRRQAAQSARDAAATAMRAATTGKVAVAFGREDRGILTSELLHFDRIITIPAHADYPVMNLAAAATVVMYELHAASLAAAGQPELPLAIQSPRATQGHKEVFISALFEGLDQIAFFRGQNPEHLRFILRQIFGRMDLSVIETDVLIGMARQIQWYVRERGGAEG
jgi:tRNA/rRNA methyltransferase